MTLDHRLRRLNEQYVAAALAGDVEWYRVHLADEFVRDVSVRAGDDWKAVSAQITRPTKVS